MKVIKDGQFYKIWRITGLHHNFLGLSFVQGSEAPLPRIESLLSEKCCSPEPLDSNEVTKEVLRGVQEANDLLMTSYRVESILFDANDTPPESTYAVLAYLIVKSVYDEVIN
ncbi:MAG: hypothetical protein JNK38_25205 [Acidobacteria bacterium]|nr:hypothetical protein [Acidobacteriota bacterium]